jgi:predicted MFS family arabinose efflux permease
MVICRGARPRALTSACGDVRVRGLMQPISRPDLSRQLVLTLAFGTAATVATIYFNQPLLPLLAKEFSATQRDMGMLVTVTQLGYAAGILALVPLGDVVNKKKLILAKLGVLLLALVAAGFSGSLAMLFMAHVAIGIFGTVAQDFIPLAADLAAPEKRGHVIGLVMSGLLIGILSSRTFSGVIADHFGWRSVFFAAAGMIAVIALLVAWLVPSRTPTVRSGYGALMTSLIRIIRERPVLRLAVLTQGLMGALFSAFWTVSAFHLSGDTFHLSTSAVGYFGLIGAAGALAAPLAGKLADRRGALANIPIAIAITFVAFVGMALLPNSLTAVIVAAALFDLGVQMSMVSHQSIIYALDPAARSRINALFVSGLFVFFAVGSIVGNVAYARYGWTGLTEVCATLCVLAYIAHRWTVAVARARPVVALA